MLACGKKETEQKDTIELQDVDYGVNGAFTINVWFRHDQENFEDYQREQFFGHGDPSRSTPSRNQVHWQFEQSGTIRTIVYDATDPDQYGCDYCNGDNEAIEASTGDPCGWNRECWGPYKGWSDTMPSQHGAVDNGNMWHMLTLTTHPDGSKGYSVYLDGQMRAGMPYAGMGVDMFETDENWTRVQTAMAGDPINPEGPMRFCGRLATYGGAETGYWADENLHGFDAGWHSRRYFMGKVTHASFFSAAMTKAQVNALMQSYIDQYNLPDMMLNATWPAPSPPPPTPVASSAASDIKLTLVVIASGSVSDYSVGQISDIEAKVAYTLGVAARAVAVTVEAANSVRITITVNYESEEDAELGSELLAEQVESTSAASEFLSTVGYNVTVESIQSSPTVEASGGDSDNSSTLSDGAIGGIAAGGFVFLLLVGAAILITQGTKNNSKSKGTSTIKIPSATSDKAGEKDKFDVHNV